MDNDMNYRIAFVAPALILLCLAGMAQTNIFIETVLVGDACNAADTTGHGSVSYVYEIGKYEVTAAQYAAFLNAVAKADPHGLYHPSMWTHPGGCKIERLGVDGDYSYRVEPQHAKRPVNYISIWDAYRFVNWLHNGRGDCDTETGAYLLAGSNEKERLEIQRNPEATWFIPNNNEWYKAAFYKGGGPAAGYWTFPVQADTVDLRTANYNNEIGRPVDVGHYGDYPSAYGTFDQGGNVCELIETGLECGGSYRDIMPYLSSASDGRFELTPQAFESVLVGFRVAFNPHPSTPPRHAFPRVKGYEVLSCDFHMHTTASDGRMSLEHRIMESRMFGFDVISITDHFVPTDMTKGAAIADALGIVLIRGMETGLTSTSMEHVVALNVAPSYQPADEHAWAEKPGMDQVHYRDRMSEISKGGGVLIYAHPHPFDDYSPATQGPREPILWGIEQGIIVGVEVKNWMVTNRWGTINSHGTWCYPFAFDWALEHNLALFANSDIHRNRMPPQAATLVLAGERTPDGIMEAVRQRRTLAWFDGMIWGRESLLTDLIEAVVSVQRTEDARTWIVENSCPVALDAVIEGAGEGAICLPAYSKTPVHLGGDPNELRIRWNNLWINPRDNLETKTDVSISAKSRTTGLMGIEDTCR